jgi:large subunit ribosomal protein L29
MKAKDIREKSSEDLVELEKSIVKEAFQARFKNFTNRLDDTSALKKARRDVARVKTILTERANIGEATPSKSEVSAKAIAPAKVTRAAKATSAAKPAKAAKTTAKKASKGSEASK